MLVAPFLLVYGIGIGLATAQLTGVIMIDVPMEQNGQASGSQSTVRQVGSALGIAVLGSMLFTGVQGNLETRLETTGLSASQQAQVVELVVDSAGGAIPVLDDILLPQQVSQEVVDAVAYESGEPRPTEMFSKFGPNIGELYLNNRFNGFIDFFCFVLV